MMQPDDPSSQSFNQASQPTAPTPPPQEAMPQSPMRPKSSRGGKLFVSWIILTVMIAAGVAGGVYTMQQARIHTLNSKIADQKVALQTKEKLEQAAKSDDQAVQTAAKTYCEGQLSVDSKLPRKFNVVPNNGKSVVFGGEEKFAQVKVDCRDVSNTDPLAPVPYTLKKTNNTWYVIRADVTDDKAITTLFGIPAVFND